MTTIMPHPFRIAIILLVALIVAGCAGNMPTRNYTATTTPTPTPPTTIPVASKENGGVEVTVRSCVRNGPEYQLKEAGYLQCLVVVHNTNGAPIEVSDVQLSAGGSAKASLNSAEIVPMQNNALGIAGVGVAGGAAGIPLAGTVAYLFNGVLSSMDNTSRASLEGAMLQPGTVSPRTSVSGLVVFRDDGMDPEALIVNYLPGGSLNFNLLSVVVQLRQESVAVTATP